MIQFIYGDGDVHITFTSDAHEAGKLLEDFRRFMHHLGYHHSTIEKVQLVEGEPRQDLPEQLELFPEDRS